MFTDFDIKEMLSAFIVLFAVIDILGSVPIILALKEKGRKVNALSASVLSLALMLAFFYAGDLILHLFNVNIESFAIAGSFIIFFMALEMILDIEIFKNEGPIKSATLVPLVFPLIAGAGSFTTLLSIKAEYSDINILIGLFLNMVCIFVVIHLTRQIQKLLGEGGIYLMRKFFGVILLAIAVKLFTTNFSQLIS